MIKTTITGVPVMSIPEIVMRLNGPVKPLGESDTDAKRLENLHTLCEITDHLLEEIDDLCENADRREASMQAIGNAAMRYLFKLEQRLGDNDL